MRGRPVAWGHRGRWLALAGSGAALALLAPRWGGLRGLLTQAAELPLAPALRLGAAALLLVGTLGCALALGRHLARCAGGPGAGVRRGTSWWRWLVPGPPAAGERLHVLSRQWLGARESLCLVGVGPRRWLLGVTAHQITLLAALDGEPGAGSRSGRSEPVGEDFARALRWAADVAPGGREVAPAGVGAPGPATRPEATGAPAVRGREATGRPVMRDAPATGSGGGPGGASRGRPVSGAGSGTPAAPRIVGPSDAAPASPGGGAVTEAELRRVLAAARRRLLGLDAGVPAGVAPSRPAPDPAADRGA